LECRRVDWKIILIRILILINLAEDRDIRRAVANVELNLRAQQNAWNSLTGFLRRIVLHGVVMSLAVV